MTSRKKMLVWSVSVCFAAAMAVIITWLSSKPNISPGAPSVPADAASASTKEGTAGSANGSANMGSAGSSSAAASVTPENGIKVTNAAQLSEAIAGAAPGQTILLADGTYTQSGAFNVTGKKGTADKPITIKAANRGKAVMSGGAGFNVSNSAFISIEGLKFTNPANLTAVKLDNSANIRVTRNTFALTENKAEGKWIVIQGSASKENRIDRNEFAARKNLGQMIAFQGSVMSQHDVIEYNYFHDSAPQKENGGETIRVGLSGSSMSNGFTTIQSNLFVNCDSDAEIISVKSGQNTVRYNTFINNKGQVTARHGHANSYYGNFFFRKDSKSGVGGLRLYANDQKVYNNYFENISGAIHIDGGDFDAGPDGSHYTSSDLAKHWRIYRAQVVHNTIVNGASGIVIGKSYTYAPVDSIVANNLIAAGSGPLYEEVKPSNTQFKGNIGHGGALLNRKAAETEVRDVDPLLKLTDGLQKLNPASPVIDAAAGGFDFVTEDMDGQTRAKNDAGADEYTDAKVVRKPLTPSDVGPNAQ